MAKWAGLIGFAEETQTDIGVWQEIIVERQYFGDMLKNYRSMGSDTNINSGIDISNQVSFVADPYANNNFHKIRYVTFMGTKWKARNVDVQYPRLNITLGGVYNEQQQTESA